MDSNTHSIGSPDELEVLDAVLERLDARDLDALADGVLADRALVLRRLGERLDGQWLKVLAVLDARGAAGAEDGVQAASTASWLRTRLRMGAGAAHRAVRTARAVFRGPLSGTAQALTAGELSPAHAEVLADGTRDLPGQVVAEAEPVLLEVARHQDPSQLRRALGHLRLVAVPDREHDQTERRHSRRGLWISQTFEGMVALQGQLDPEAGQTVLAALEPLARPANAEDERTGSQRTADALTELARRQLEGGRLPQTGGVRPQLLVTVDLDTLLGGPGVVGGDGGWTGPLDPEACQRLACDATVTRVVVSRHPNQQPPAPSQSTTTQQPGVGPPGVDQDTGPTLPTGDQPVTTPAPTSDPPLAGRLRAAMTLLPPILGGAPTQPLEVGRTSRVVTPSQRAALIVRDGGCVFPGCQRPPAWCEAHHVVHWLHGGPTDLDNLALLCRAHHRAVHEGGWQLVRDPDGRFTATPPRRRSRDRTHHSAA